MNQPVPSSPPPVAPPAPPTATYVTRSAHFPPDIERVTRGAIRINPTLKMYENLEADERVVLYLGRHWTRLTRPYMVAGMCALLPLIVFPFLLAINVAPFVIRYGLVLTWFWYCFIFYYLLAVRVGWRSDVYIITNERIIDFDANAFFFRKVTDTDLESIHEVHYEAGGGLIGGSIDRGDVIVTDVSGSRVIMKNIPRPRDIALVIGELVEAAKAHGSQAAPATVSPPPTR